MTNFVPTTNQCIVTEILEKKFPNCRREMKHDFQDENDYKTVYCKRSIYIYSQGWIQGTVSGDNPPPPPRTLKFLTREI